MNIGEELVGDYLQFIEGCEFVRKNLHTKDVQGEIDVVGINIERKTVFLCEVAIHLATGLQYVLNKRPNNINKLTEKFSKDILYARKYFPEKDGFNHRFMLWTPIVKTPVNKTNKELQELTDIILGKPSKTQYNQSLDVETVQSNIRKKFNTDIELIINDVFLKKMEELREYARSQTEELKSPVLRLYQIEEKLKKHVIGRLT